MYILYYVYYIVAGFGKSDGRNPIFPEYLKNTEMDVITNAECDQYYSETIGGDAICAIEIGTSVCSGDSGGPLYYVVSFQNRNKLFF